MQDTRTSINEFESVLGTPSAQKLIRLLVVWSSLSVQDLVIKSKVSKSQVHNTLNNLSHHGITLSPSRGIYILSDNPFTKLLKKAYHIKIVEQVNTQIYQIIQLLKQGKVDIAEVVFQELVLLYEPLLYESFSNQLSSLSHRFIEGIGK